MNHRMWQHPRPPSPSTDSAGWGVQVLDPVDGPHACGENGAGRLAEPEQIVTRVLAALAAP